MAAISKRYARNANFRLKQAAVHVISHEQSWFMIVFVFFSSFGPRMAWTRIKDRPSSTTLLTKEKL
jgi:hypothetical protein